MSAVTYIWGKDMTSVICAPRNEAGRVSLASQAAYVCHWDRDLSHPDRFWNCYVAAPEGRETPEETGSSTL